ncbi:hypothetical protein [Salibacterium halotolerans]|uniref:Uncharacterized protein n=1 Tax=Salibacterium halotolerans TaxID=1884432 RepID=A0A1I5XK32_9BACI|nr:hypothetical protein [Salibacterium halotolerans]SFQ32332.1 hypothetical protein SAMN05518683_1292 [Salibacterium halotolerans]
MRNKYTVMFLMLFAASIAGGSALNQVFEYAMLVGMGAGVIFLLCSAYTLGKNEKKAEPQ